MGITEFVTNYLLDPSLTPQGMMAATLLRFLCWYAVVIPGAVWSIHLIQKTGMRYFLGQEKV